MGAETEEGGNNQGGKENLGGKSPGDKTVAAFFSIVRQFQAAIKFRSKSKMSVNPFWF